MCLAQGPQRSDAGETRTRDPSVSSQALPLGHCAPMSNLKFYADFFLSKPVKEGHITYFLKDRHTDFLASLISIILYHD